MEQAMIAPFRKHLLFGLLCALSQPAAGQPGPKYPVSPKPLEVAAEIALARSAAPPEVSDSAEVVAIRDGEVRVIHRGSSGAACMVARDLHEGSLYPICFNPEGARTVMHREVLQGRLRSMGIAEDSIDRGVEAGYRDGTLKLPEAFAIAYMMSPRQVLFSTPKAEGRRVGAWHPHVMIYTPNSSASDLGLARAGQAAGVFQVGVPGTHHTEFIIIVSRWSDGTPGPAGKG